MFPWGRLTESKSIFEFFTSCSVSSVCLSGMGLNLCLPEGYLVNLFVPVCACFCVCVCKCCDCLSLTKGFTSYLLNSTESITWRNGIPYRKKSFKSVKRTNSSWSLLSQVRNIIVYQSVSINGCFSALLVDFRLLLPISVFVAFSSKFICIIWDMEEYII